MQVPPEVEFKGIDVTPELDTLLQQQIARLERVCGYIVSLHVAVEREQGRHKEGNPYRVRLDIRVPPNHQIVVKRQSVLHVDTRAPAEIEETAEKHSSITTRKDEPLPAVIRRAFDSTRRQLERLVERQRGEMKAHPQNQVTAFVERIFRTDGYGFLRSIEGEQIYFNKNSTLHGEWERMELGTGVRYSAEQGEKGLQATSVEIVSKLGTSEIHDELHELPVVAKLKVKKQ